MRDSQADANGAHYKDQPAPPQRRAPVRHVGALASVLHLLPQLKTHNQTWDFEGSDAVAVQALIGNLDTAVGALNRGIAAIGLLIADSSPEIEDGTIHQESVEALGWLLSELGELASLCIVMAAQGRQAHPTTKRRPIRDRG